MFGAARKVEPSSPIISDNSGEHPGRLLTVNAVLDVYEKDRADPNSRRPCEHPKGIAYANVAVRKSIGDVTIGELYDNAEEIQSDAEREWYDAGAAKGTVNKRISQLQTAIRVCIRRKLIRRDDEPFLQRPGNGPPRERYLDRETEWPKLREELENPRTPFHLNLLTRIQLGGMQRVGATLALEWEMCDFGANTIWYKRTGGTKNKRRVNIPMSAGVRDCLERAQKRAKTKYVIEWQGQPVKTVYVGFQAIIARAGLEDVRIHDLRRTGATWAFQAGVPLTVVAALLGDNPEIVRRHYAHCIPSFLSEASDSVDAIMKAGILP